MRARTCDFRARRGTSWPAHGRSSRSPSVLDRARRDRERVGRTPGVADARSVAGAVPRGRASRAGVTPRQRDDRRRAVQRCHRFAEEDAAIDLRDRRGRRRLDAAESIFFAKALVRKELERRVAADRAERVAPRSRLRRPDEAIAAAWRRRAARAPSAITKRLGAAPRASPRTSRPRLSTISSPGAVAPGDDARWRRAGRA